MCAPSAPPSPASSDLGTEALVPRRCCPPRTHAVLSGAASYRQIGACARGGRFFDERGDRAAPVCVSGSPRRSPSRRRTPWVLREGHEQWFRVIAWWREVNVEGAGRGSPRRFATSSTRPYREPPMERARAAEDESDGSKCGWRPRRSLQAATCARGWRYPTAGRRTSPSWCPRSSSLSRTDAGVSVRLGPWFDSLWWRLGS